MPYCQGLVAVLLVLVGLAHAAGDAIDLRSLSRLERGELLRGLFAEAVKNAPVEDAQDNTELLDMDAGTWLSMAEDGPQDTPSGLGIPVDLSGPVLHTEEYNHAIGPGAAQRVAAHLFPELFTRTLTPLKRRPMKLKPLN